MPQSAKIFFVVGILGVVFFILVLGLGNALMPLIVAFGLAYLSFPPIRWLEDRGLNRSYAIAGVFTSISMAIALAFLLVLPSLIADARQFFQELPHASAVAVEKVESFARTLGFNVDMSKQGLKDILIQHSSAVSSEFLVSSSNLVRGVFTNFFQVVLTLLNLFLIPLFFFHLVNRYETIAKEAVELVPIPWRPKVYQYAQITNTVLNGYVRGQILAALILAVLYGIGFWVIGLRFGLIIGIATGLLSIIPFVGSVLGFTAVMTIALANFTGFATVVSVAVVFVVIQALEGLVITPKLVGDKVGLGVLSTILALIIGGNLFGFVGMIVEIPVAAVMKSVLQELMAEYKTLSLYKGT